MSGRAPARLERTATVHPAAEAAGAFVAGAALFLLAGAASPIRHTLVLVLALGAVYVYVVVLAAKRLGPAYGVTLAIAAGTAFDSFFIPPTREFGSAEWQNWIVIAIYIAAGVLVGMIAARSRRSAELSAHTRDLLLEEQGALRRVATLVAQQTASSDVLAAVARELGQLLAVDATYVVRYHSDETARSVARWTRGADRIPTDATITLEGDSVITRVARTRRPARMDSYAGARGGPAAMGQELGVQAAVGAPIIVEADLWGAMIAASNEEAALPADTEDRLMAFSELVATAIANTEAQGEVRRLAEEQAALRRVATLVARGVPRERLFEAVVEELERLMPADVVAMAQYESDDTITTLATGGDVPAGFGSGVRWPVGGKNVTTLVAQTGRAARLDTYADAADKLDSAIREQGIRTSVGTPIMVEGKLWGVMHAASMHEQPLPADTEARLASFTELVATAIANTEARAQVRRLLDEQAGLRRVATLVARGVPATELFPLVVEEVGTLLGTALAGLVRFGGDGTLRPVAAWSADGEHPSLPERWPIEDGDAAALIVHARRPVRIDDWNEVHGPIASFIREIGISCSAASPILVEGRLWGALAVHMTGRDSLAADTELRLENFTELVATAISNAEARVAVQRLADEQAALRRVAMLVARESPREDVFEAVASEVAGLLDVDNTLLLRYENDGTAT
ncbi:MAG: hypothetical protein QOC55_1326, partial [Thermoleophilaceae bacterium]|nr:hypothetical protein [Thermoleophilaceae bacterium]